MAVMTLKQRLTKRFLMNRDKLGRDWKRKMAMAYARYNTMEGASKLARVATGCSSTGSIGIQTLDEVVLDMEKLLDDIASNAVPERVFDSKN
jgi:hypothetical protein